MRVYRVPVNAYLSAIYRWSKLDTVPGVLGDTGLTAREQPEAFLVLIGHVRSNTQFTAGLKLLEKRRGRYPALMAAIDSGASADRQKTAWDSVWSAF